MSTANTVVVHGVTTGARFASFSYRDPITGKPAERRPTVPAHVLASLPVGERERITTAMARHGRPSGTLVDRFKGRFAFWAKPAAGRQVAR